MSPYFRKSRNSISYSVFSAFFVMLSVLTFNGHASIKLYIADSSAIHTALGKSPDSLWFRKAAYDAVKDGTVPLVDPDSTYWVDSVKTTTQPNAFANLLDTAITHPQNKYMVVGVADDFIVPKTGEYSFEIKGDDALFIVIDGQLLTDAEGKAFLYDGLDDPVDPTLGDNGYPDVKVSGTLWQPGDGYFSTVNLDSGSHSFEFYFYDKSTTTMTELYWTLPGTDEKTHVPSSAFYPRKNYGPFLIETVDWVGGNNCPHEIWKTSCPHDTIIKARIVSGVPAGDTVYFHWDFFNEQGGEGEVDHITKATVEETTFVETTFYCEANNELIGFHVWGQIGDRQTPEAEGGSCNILYCKVNQCPEKLEVMDPDSFARCEAEPPNDCDGHIGVIYERTLAVKLSDIQASGEYSIYSLSGRKLGKSDLRKIEKNGFKSNGVYILKLKGSAKPERIIRMAQ